MATKRCAAIGAYSQDRNVLTLLLGSLSEQTEAFKILAKQSKRSKKLLKIKKKNQLVLV